MLSGKHLLFAVVLATPYAVGLRAAPIPFGDFFTRAAFTVPSDLNETHPNRDDVWSRYESSELQQTYIYTVTGGVGTGYLFFQAYVTASDHQFREERYDLHSYVSGTVSLNPSMFEWGGHAFNSCSGYSCGPVEFTYGVPQIFRVYLLSTAGYRWRRLPYEQCDNPAGCDSGAAGSEMFSEAWLNYMGVYDFNHEQGWTQNENATLNISPVPEPASLWILAAGGVGLGFYRRATRPDRFERSTST